MIITDTVTSETERPDTSHVRPIQLSDHPTNEHEPAKSPGCEANNIPSKLIAYSFN
jgi:hypothetical protein